MKLLHSLNKQPMKTSLSLHIPAVMQEPSLLAIRFLAYLDGLRGSFEK